MSEDFKVQQFEVDGISLTKLEVPTRVEDSRLTPSEIEIAERLLRILQRDRHRARNHALYSGFTGSGSL